MTFLVIIYQTKNSTQFFEKMFWSPGFLYILTVSLKNVAEGPCTQWFIIWYCNTNIQKTHSSFSFPSTPYRRVQSQKSPDDKTWTVLLLLHLLTYLSTGHKISTSKRSTMSLQSQSQQVKHNDSFARLYLINVQLERK